MTDYAIEQIDGNEYAFTEPGAPERSTGWQDCYCVDMSTGEVDFFDAEANQRCAVSPIRDLAVAISQLEDALDDELWDQDVREFDEPRGRSMALSIALGVEDF